MQFGVCLISNFNIVVVVVVVCTLNRYKIESNTLSDK